MMLVVESGSTKADWLLYDGHQVKGPFHTIGLNPIFHNSENVVAELEKSSELTAIKDHVTSVHFFGAGCSSRELCEIIAKGLRIFFSNAGVNVDHDLLASALATCGDEPGIACIIGTGSNSCWFDGKALHERNYGLGYILGDEGSGSYFGKKLLTAFLYGLMPQDLHQQFLATYRLDKHKIIDKVYKEPGANVWLASFTRFLTANYNHEYIRKMIHSGMREFCELYVCGYTGYRDVKVHFVGSLASLFRIELEQVAHELGFSLGKVIKQPIDELMNYFISQENNR